MDNDIDQTDWRNLGGTPDVSMTIRLPYPPSLNRLYRAVRGRSVKSADGRAYASLASGLVMASRVRVTGPFVLSVLAVRPDKRARDLDNLLKPVLDVLQAGGAIENDSLCQCLMIRWADVSAGISSHSETAQLPFLTVILEGK
jgi:Holliday junction resolvase RusA-like endonuclease